MAIAIGDVSMEIVFALRLVGAVPDIGKSRDRSISETVLLPVFATRAAPVPSLMATPVGVVPTVTAGTFWVRVTRSRTEAVPLVLLATTANPKRGLTAIPCGAVPVSIGFPIGCPKVALAGLTSTTETLLQPVLVTTAMGANP